MISIRLPVAMMACALACSPAVAASIDLSGWLINGSGSWSFSQTAAPNDTATQASNSPPTVLHSNSDSQGTSISGEITALSAIDNDFIGFVLGYSNGDITTSSADSVNSNIDYLLFDWKQGTQSGAPLGTALSRVTGDIRAGGTDVTADAWTHSGVVNELARGTNFGSTGYAINTPYTFDILFTENRVKIDINNVTEFDILASSLGLGPDFKFSDGAFGFYNFSQPSVRYAGLTGDTVPDDFDDETPVIPVPASLPLLMGGLAGLGFLRQRRKSKVN